MLIRGPAFFAYADNYLIDVKSGVIVDVEASRSVRQAEVGAARTMIERTEERFCGGSHRWSLGRHPPGGHVYCVAWELHRGRQGRRIKAGRS